MRKTRWSMPRFALCILVALLVGTVLQGVIHQAGKSRGVLAAQETSKAAEHAGEAGEAHAEGGHTDSFAPILLELAVIVLIAVVGRWVAGRCKQPSVLGELLIGVVVGNVGYSSSVRGGA